MYCWAHHLEPKPRQMESCLAEELPGVLGEPILRGPGRGSGQQSSGAVCKVRSGLEVSVERLFHHLGAPHVPRMGQPRSSQCPRGGGC